MGADPPIPDPGILQTPYIDKNCEVAHRIGRVSIAEERDLLPTAARLPSADAVD